MYDTTQIVDCKEKKTIFFVNFFCSKVFTRRFSYVKMTRKPIFGGFMVYVLNFSAMTDEEKAVAVCLQGIVNRTEKSIVIDVDNYMS